MKKVLFLLIGTFFGIVLYKSEAASWFRIYEMFNFHSFHMYGIMGSALLCGILIVQVIKRRGLRDFFGYQIQIRDKENKVTRYILGGFLFGMGWALAGACPGPMYVLLGSGAFSIGVVIIFAVLGTYIYGIFKDKLPH
ncbi:MAG: DUF6691 family protein [Bacteroidota bacterium]